MVEISSCRRVLKALFHGIKFYKLVLSFAKISSIEVDPVITNIAIYNDSLTLMSVIFMTFLHFARNFGKALEIPIKKNIFTYFLLCLCEKIVSGTFFLQGNIFAMQIKNLGKILPLGSFKLLHQLQEEKYIFVNIKNLILLYLLC